MHEGLEAGDSKPSMGEGMGVISLMSVGGVSLRLRLRAETGERSRVSSESLAGLTWGGWASS